MFWLGFLVGALVAAVVLTALSRLEVLMNWMLCLGIAIAWAIGSALLVYAICRNCGRLSEKEDENLDYRELDY